MNRHLLRDRTDLRIAAGTPVVGLLVWTLTGEWRWSVTGLLITAAVVATTAVRRRGGKISTVIGVLALPAGLALWLWTADSRWAALGLFPILFVLIGRLAAAVEHRR